ncbi:hypothetical protein JMK10_09635 [Rhodovulum sulfidophilum]|uniref:hypothetical protein n=1 Tax=Rhodovulum sulfidophilum TaxID=35806 RepID=UPI001920FCF2|nr:hypothetical protein [Rhodovulum sulfidophilum]MBL3572827.1 hypothetical protein [Rhodovulum sulfidophilum]MCE8433782.1 hypothetical protein [Rhodovulum sulfidophilum]MCF4117064.1 hypothetical protein [Rhodovulum sulfidophilum]
MSIMDSIAPPSDALAAFVAEWRGAAPEVRLAAIRGALRRHGIEIPVLPGRVAFYEIQLFGLTATGRDEAEAAQNWMEAAIRLCPFD